MTPVGKARLNHDSQQGKLICVTVACRGHGDFCVSLQATVTIRQIKLLAMQHFNLESASVDHYSIHHNGDAQHDMEHIAGLGGDRVGLTLKLGRASRFGETLFLR
jgi:hypothetical protein